MSAAGALAPTGRPDIAMRPLVALASVWLALALAFHGTTGSLFSLWWRSGTYTHCLLILPIAAWLVWRRVADGTEPVATWAPAWVVAVPAVACVLAWWLARELAVLVLEQLAFVLLLPLTAWMLLGHAFARRNAFALLFILLAVPVGEGLVPPMMEVTADMVVFLLRVTGVAVVREGLYFSTTVGDFRVAEACSGVRYMIASVTLCLLYAHLNYRSWWRWTAFMALSILVPVAANGLRAYGIVLIAHHSDMRYAVGVDHLVYGWVFFGVVMLVLFTLGASFRDVRPASPPDAGAAAGAPWSIRVAAARAALVAASVAWAAVLPAGLLSSGGAESAHPAGGHLRVPAEIAGFVAAPAAFPTTPQFAGADEVIEREFRRGDRSVYVYAAMYRGERRGHELANAENRPYEKGPWSLVQRDSLPLDLRGEALAAERFVVQHGRRRFMVLQWYVVDGRRTSSVAMAKVLSIWASLRGRPTGATAVLLAVPAQDVREAEAGLGEFASSASAWLAGLGLPAMAPRE